MCAKAARIEKNSTAPTLVSENRFYGALRSVKKTPFLTYTVINAEEAAPPRGEKSARGNFNKSRTCCAESRTCCAARRGPVSSGLSFKIFNSSAAFRGGAAMDFFQKNRGRNEEFRVKKRKNDGALS